MSESFAQELAGHVPRMYRVALRIVGTSDAAQEATQNACLKALRRAETFGGRAALATWLHRITVNCAHDHLRKDRRADRGRVACDQNTLGMLAVLEAGPAEQAERRDLSPGPDAGRQTARRLPLGVRAHAVGRIYLHEAAAIESQARGTVASRVYRAWQILLEQMNHHFAGEVP